ncbi:MAG: hypothetical protein KA257_00685 [Opitutaceae bacterium]|nr:hypothetical protein [Opitutaceae bacterium]
MDFQAASPASIAAFLVIVTGVIAALLGAVHFSYRADAVRARRMTSLVAFCTALWLGLLAGLITSGYMAALPLSGLPLFFGSVLIVSCAVGVSPLGGRLAAGVPIAALVGFQAFRLPLELVLHSWSAQGVIPVTMTWTGRNWDIVSGTVALVAFPWAGRSRAIAWFANLVGLGLLLNVMRVALMSSPVPFGWDVTPPLLLALHLPYALIGPVCVGGALLGHIVLTRKLWTVGRDR